jgi:two-component system chemotaxis sensor kinase CheA
VGLVVDRIIDVVDEVITLEDAHARAGVLGSAVLEGRVTELLDLENPALVGVAASELRGQKGAGLHGPS